MSAHNDPFIQRYNTQERLNHWFTAIAFILLILSGFSLFHPSLFWLTNLFGGGPWTRILHPYIGVVMFVSFSALALRFWHHNFLSKNDIQWLKQIPDVIQNHEEKLPEVDRYNAGQKLLFWTMVITIPTLFVTGIIIWQPWFTPYFPRNVDRFAVLLHAFFAFVMSTGIIVHVYAAIWVKGTIRAMIRGTVARGWVKKHHPGWYKRIEQGQDH